MSNDDKMQAQNARPVSQRKINANRRNALKSTGPRTPAGKRASSFNATRHSVLAKVMPASQQGESLRSLRDSLREEYGSGDVRIELLIDNIVGHQWRLTRAIDFESYCLDYGVNAFQPQGPLMHLDRYTTASRRALFQGVELLERFR